MNDSTTARLEAAKETQTDLTVCIGTYGGPVLVHVVEVHEDGTVVLSFQDQSVHKYDISRIKVQKTNAPTTTWGYFEDVGNAHAFAREIDPDAWELGDKANFATLVSVAKSEEEAELLVTQFTIDE